MILVFLLDKLLHSPSLVSVGLSVGYEAWPLFGWHHSFVIGSSKLPRSQLIVGLCERWEFPSFFMRPLTVSLRSPNGRQFACR